MARAKPAAANMSEGALSYLDVYLAPLLPILARADVTDILINRPGEIWVETLGGAMERIADHAIDEQRLRHLARQIASLNHQGISREHPLLAATLPDGARVQVVAPPATRGHMAIAIRKHVMPDLRLGDYVSGGAFAETRVNIGAAPQSALALPASDSPGAVASFLADLVRERRNVLISGGTATGKTTFLNALIKEIPAQERLVLIEDTAELSIAHDNVAALIATKGEQGEALVTAEDLLQAALRMRPDRIILGELRGREAYTFLRAVNTGHPGSLSTIHADSPEGALEQLALIVLQSGTQLRRDDILDYARQVIDVIVQLERRDGERRIARVMLTRG
ncbi:P-type DNA transfer ATPase VirB11 [Sphingomonas sp. GlSt437]|uniref:P-type DNA transfer ATPase VirB11 n=1 Tax=Sphingomonas sp. GlSt437 TaxID=3389970 RepID=UPI003A83DBD9